MVTSYVGRKYNIEKMENNSVFQNDCPIWPLPISQFASSSMVQCNQQEQLNQIRIPGDQCGWDWPEELPGIARMHISEIHSDVSSQHLNSGHYRKDGLFPENPEVGYPVSNFLHDGRNEHSLETHNFTFGGPNNSKTCSNSNPVTNKKPSEQSWTRGCESLKSYQNEAPPYEAKSSVLPNELLKLGYSRDTMFLSTMDREGIQSDPKHMPKWFGSTNFSCVHGGRSGDVSAHHAFLFPVNAEQHMCPKAANGMMDGNHAVVGKQIFEPSTAKGNKAGFPRVRDHEIGGESNDIFLFGKKINDKGRARSLDNSHKAAELNLKCFPIFSGGENMQMLAAQDLVESCKHSPLHRSIHEFEMLKMSCDKTQNFFCSSTPGGSEVVSGSKKTHLLLTPWMDAGTDELALFTGLAKNYNLSDLSQKADCTKTDNFQHVYDVYSPDQSLLSSKHALFNSSQWRDVPRKMTMSCDRCKNNSLVDEGSGISSNCKNCVFYPAALSHERDFHGVGQWEDFEIENKAKRKINNESSENFELLKRKRLHCSVPISSEVHIGESNSCNSFTVTSSGDDSSFFKQKVKPIVCHKYGIITNGSPMKQTRIVSMKNVLIAAKRASNTEHYEIHGILQSEVEGPNVEKVGFCGCCVDATQKQSNADDCTTGKKDEFTCSRTEGYKGRKCSCSWCSVSHCLDGDYRCHVPQDQLNVWLHIHTHKSFPRGQLDSKAEFEYDSREQYARFKQSKGWKHLLVYKSIIHGHGLYTSQFIPRGSVVVEYIGEVVGPRVADKRETEYQSGKKMQYKGACYLFKVDKEQIIDGTRKGGIARFVNHSCLPNCVAKVISVRNEKKVVFYADREIYPGEEVTYDYHFKKEDVGEKIHCNCRSRNCRRYLN
ncbi:hypothetical protein Leryth_005265 [Lithospermum erythrorhizon]|nr:hypothetical protein Leryth_005265 [Lithospermum erythrorhizon]